MIRNILRSLKKQTPASQGLPENIQPVFERFSFQINQKIKITLHKSEGRVSYRSSVQEIYEDIIGIAVPLEKGTYVFVQENTPLDFQVYSSTGMYSFTSHIIGKTTHPVPLFYVRKPQQIRRSQQREYIRTNAYLPVYFYQPVSNRIAQPLQMVQRQQAFSRDISAGGICITMPVKPLSRSMLDLQIDMPVTDNKGSDLINTRGQVLRVDKDRFQDKFLVGMSFHDISAADRERINQYAITSERLDNV